MGNTMSNKQPSLAKHTLASRLDALYNTVTSAIVIYNARGEVIHANVAAERLFRKTLDTLQLCDDLMEDASIVFEDGSPCQSIHYPVRRILADGEPIVNLVLGIVTSRSERQWLLINAHPVSTNGELTEIIATYHDYSDRMQQQYLRGQYSAAFKASLDGMAVVDQHGAVNFSNEMFAKLHGAAHSQAMIGRTWLQYFDPQEEDRLRWELQEARTSNDSWHGQATIDAGGLPVALRLSVSFTKDHQSVVVARDITDEVSVEQTILYHSYHDSLTGLPNWTLFQERLSLAMHHARAEDERLAVMFLDIDHFRSINESLGYQAGDALLRDIAQRIQSCLGEEHMLARLGGDKYTVLLTEVTSASSTMAVAENILKILNDPWSYRKQRFSLTMSIGIALFPEDGDNIESLLASADTAMHRAKASGRNTFQMYSPSMNASAHERLTLEHDLVRALQEQQFVLHYQPQLDLQTGRIVGVEVLTRWLHPERGLVPPDQFIPLAEDMGLIVPLGQWVLETALRQGMDWRERGYSQLRIGVNVSSRQFAAAQPSGWVWEALDKTGFPPEWLDLEITERIAMEDVKRTLKVLQQWRNLGIKISLDDFGTGYSSLKYLKLFPITSLKIDRSFVDEMTKGETDRAIVRAIIALAVQLGLTTIAEGVETTAQRDLLTELGCNEMQGYVYSRPVEAAVLEKMLPRN